MCSRAAAREDECGSSGGERSRPLQPHLTILALDDTVGVLSLVSYRTAPHA
jgi:hypothetical protein